MGYDEFIDYYICLRDVLELTHAPFMSKDKVNIDNA